MEYLYKKVIAVLVVDDITALPSKIEKLLSDGFDVLEITLRTECAFQAIQLAKKTYPNVKVGAGTILTIEQLEKCIEIGADFGVAPGLNPEIVNKAKAMQFPFIPGIATASEVEQAMSLGVSLVKVFPAKIVGGVEFIKAMSGPYHTMKFMPTGGVTEADYKDYLSLPSVLCVGGTWMGK
ncbi:MAG: 2-dehydro-3-deoxyphosphogluconate aldolase/(4S)-4-hydroxy-2-oxoglutarate aldolase [Psychromonas sp.]|jgi:2-dehydro-3-deoxyphosphogluconate aldolase/(4S)-4-hydroxy-2-oxoglutarate aldolase|uniref:bifunctional 4-hydroxy-2-oxoglutarate aldolase/2-dehydro-3-deoxy-phosphogluconate aldolase n=1 Tax=Psychromonas sp. TaxID=1884585 RepID=UPI0039E3650C